MEHLLLNYAYFAPTNNRCIKDNSSQFVQHAY
jgi:hypothetical protein